MEPGKQNDDLMNSVIWGGLLTLFAASPIIGGAAIAGKLGWSWWKKGTPAREERRRHRRQLQLEKERRKTAQTEIAHRERLLRKQEEERAKLPPPPPPPTREALAAAARERLEATLRFLETANLDAMELQAARLRAKQQYLRELERLM